MSNLNEFLLHAQLEQAPIEKLEELQRLTNETFTADGPDGVPPGAYERKSKLMDELGVFYDPWDGVWRLLGSPGTEGA